MRKVLVYGAGVLGSYLAHVLMEAGNDVNVLARGARKAELERDGLVIRHYVQRKTTVDRPAIVATGEGTRWDAVFAVMQYQQMQGALRTLAALDTAMLVLVGNNVDALGMERTLHTMHTKAETIVFGFQATGGRREGGRVICVRMGKGRLTCGFADRPPDDDARASLVALFANTGYKLMYEPNMSGWYMSHLAFILPVAYLCYANACDLTRAKRWEINAIVEAMREGFRLLETAGIPVLPAGSDTDMAKRGKRTLTRAMLWLMAKTPVGRLVASDHCRSAVGEMEVLSTAFESLRASYPMVTMPAWEALRARKQDWLSLHRQYDRK